MKSQVYKWGLGFLALATSVIANQVPPTVLSISDYFDHIKNDHDKLKAFLTSMPKGGDLHSHLSGAVYAENIIHFGATKGYCLNEKSDIISHERPCSDLALADLTPTHPHYSQVIGSWSVLPMNGPQPENHDHFYAIFSKITAISRQDRGNFLADVKSHAAAERLQYLELMLMPDNGTTAALARPLNGGKQSWSTLEKLIRTREFEAAIQKGLRRIDRMETAAHQLLHCGTPSALPGCQVQVRYLAEVFRAQPRAQVFAQLLTAFEFAKRDSRVVGINFVGPEDHPIALADYLWQMRALQYLHRQYPTVHVALHAGEFRADWIKSAIWRDHIATAIHLGGAERIGHGTALTSESKVERVLQDLITRQIPIEINLTSNAKVLSISGQQHPLPLYQQHRVPLVLSTDDAGIFRTTLSEQYFIAAMEYHWDYRQIKQVNRNGLTYSFLPGKSLWKRPDLAEPVPICKAALQSHQLNGHADCQRYLAENEKAKQQWELEQRLFAFEQPIALNLKGDLPLQPAPLSMI